MGLCHTESRLVLPTSRHVITLSRPSLVLSNLNASFARSFLLLALKIFARRYLPRRWAVKRLILHKAGTKDVQKVYSIVFNGVSTLPFDHVYHVYD